MGIQRITRAYLVDENFCMARREAPIGRGNARRIAKLVISLMYFAVQESSRFILQIIGRSPSPQLVVLYYHGVPAALRRSFVRQLEAIRRSAHVYPASYRGSLLAGRRNVAFTFDDAYASVAENALPELATRGFHATIFVPIGSLGRRPSWAVEEGSPDSTETVMAAEQITALPSSLVTLGSHTSTHPRLSQIDHDEARREICDSRRELQAIVTQEVRLLAFPYGDYDSSTVEFCKAAGYEQAFSIAANPVDPKVCEFVRGRVKVDPLDWPVEFFLKYHGAYAWTSYVPSIKRKLGGYRQSWKGHPV